MASLITMGERKHYFLLPLLWPQNVKVLRQLSNQTKLRERERETKKKQKVLQRKLVVINAGKRVLSWGRKVGPHKKETNLEIFRCFFSAELGEKSSEKEEGNFTPSLLMSRFLACPGCIDLTNYANFGNEEGGKISWFNLGELSVGTWSWLVDGNPWSMASFSKKYHQNQSPRNDVQVFVLWSKISNKVVIPPVIPRLQFSWASCKKGERRNNAEGGKERRIEVLSPLTRERWRLDRPAVVVLAIPAGQFSIQK